MYNLLWRLTLLSSRLLPIADQDPLLGDLEERRLNGTAQGLAAVWLVVGAQQFRLWAGWRPWAALLSLFLPLNMLIGCAFSIAAITAKYPWHNVDPFTSTQLVNISLAGSVATAIWSWSVGFGLGWVARRAYASALLLLTLACFLFIDANGPLRLKLLAVLMTAALIVGPALAGLQKGLRGVPLSARHALGLSAIAIAALHWTVPQQPGFTVNLAYLAASVLLFLWPILLPIALHWRNRQRPA